MKKAHTMKELENIHFIGTSHIAPESVSKVKKLILELKPDFVAVELDKRRLASLLSKKKGSASWRDVGKIGVKGWLFAVLGAWVEKKLGKKVGISPGEEMVQAVKTAQKVSAKIALIDQDIEITLRRFSRALTWREKWNFVVDLVKGLVFRKGIKFDLSKVPPEKIVEKLLKEVKGRYPNVYRVLIKERNQVMARNLAILMKEYPDSVIVAAIGAGHERDMKALLKKYLKAETI